MNEIAVTSVCVPCGLEDTRGTTTNVLNGQCSSSWLFTDKPVWQFIEVSEQSLWMTSDRSIHPWLIKQWKREKSEGTAGFMEQGCHSDSWTTGSSSSWWLSLPPQRGRVIPCQWDPMLWTFNQLKKYSLLQDDNLTDKSAVCFLFTGTRRARNKGLGTAQGQGTGPSWLSVCKYRWVTGCACTHLERKIPEVITDCQEPVPDCLQCPLLLLGSSSFTTPEPSQSLPFGSFNWLAHCYNVHII